MLAFSMEMPHQRPCGIEPNDEVANVIQAHDQNAVRVWNAARPQRKLVHRQQQLQTSPGLDWPQRA